MKITKADSRQGGGSLQGYLYADEATITKALGFAPERYFGDKVEIEWRANIEGVYVTIYDYKGEKDPFHIGGLNQSAVWACKQLFGRFAVAERERVRWMR